MPPCRRVHPTVHHLRGVIASAGFASGDRIVVGHWDVSPIGPFTDVMWARPDGERVLVVPSAGAGEFVAGVYVFDRVVEAGPFQVDADPRGTVLVVQAGQLAVALHAGRGWRIPLGARRPPWVTRWVEAPVARRLLGVRAYGVSPTGVREWYRADEFRPVVAATASVAGRDLGPLEPAWTPTGFGFSEPPRRPAIVRVRPQLLDPSGRLDLLVARLAPAGGPPVPPDAPGGG